MENKYIPVSCALYDQLELLAMRRMQANIVFEDDLGTEQTHEGIVSDVHSAKDRVEYMVFQDGFKVRLDRLRTLNGEIYSPTC